ncbi:metal-sensitive transcriptional regulator [Arthrobacter sp. zg-Y820]|uniref:metal-sensitive transcriptional regulator n=1 Tax=unclassified Arthrobacter TaxID=235627 RepID=UPI001E2CDBD2|nr:MULTISPECIES: metal-sensitive transcriptional regulator [unclassified Arthrobacter]MCC9197805.1 metal-sensitive transcriptional regulator [Arthrobacter sp. zg-Y820]MDK1280672.1 metal-sensitive transcriptional regulator [Arthrobacter sp. zg.Y820]WIB10695.1 metal-sensitive transcriptional regulator [Arthrobacter sp. zg-Y820]
MSATTEHAQPARGHQDDGSETVSAVQAPSPADPHAGTHGYASDKEAYLKRLRRIEGQVRGIARMVEEDKYCIDVLTQVAAINKALHAVSLGLVQDHISHCVVDAAREADATGNPGLVQEKVQEATDAIGRLLR